MKASGIKHDGRAEKTAPAAAVDVLGAAGERGVRDTETPLPDPDPGPPPPDPDPGPPPPDPDPGPPPPDPDPLPGGGGGVDDAIFEQNVLKSY